MILFVKNVYSTLMVSFSAKKLKKNSNLKKLEKMMMKESIFKETAFILLKGVYTKMGMRKIPGDSRLYCYLSFRKGV